MQATTLVFPILLRSKSCTNCSSKAILPAKLKKYAANDLLFN